MPQRGTKANRRTRKILVLNDQRAICDLLQIALGARGRRNFLLAASNLAEGLLVSREFSPDVILLEPLLNEGAPVDLAQEILRSCPASRLLIFTRSSSPELAREMMLAGAHGCLTTKHSLAELHEALEMVLRRKLYFDEISRPSPSENTRPAGQLSAREKQVLCLVAEGFSTKEIASRMAVSTKTAGKFRERLMGKLDLHDAVHLTHYAIRHGLVAA